MTISTTLGHLLAGPDLDQLLVPEIQRDYVWGPPQLDQLLDSLGSTYAKSLRPLDLHVHGADASAHLTQAVLRQHRLQRFSHQLGFLYAYHDQAYGGKAFLIDGQQRLLTLYLLLLAQAVRENQQAHFAAHYVLPGGSLRLDYRVREATQEFLPRFVQFVLATTPVAGAALAPAVRAQYWFFRTYELDETIAHVLENYDYLAARADSPSYDFLQHQVRFWFFDTGNSARGEELYLSLNSTGLLTSAGENERARLLEPITDLAAKRHWGQKLEQWQSFFWKHRNRNSSVASNADPGFNEFFRWVRVLGLVVAEPAAPGGQSAARHVLLTAGLAAADPLTPAVNLATADQLMQALLFLFPPPGSPANQAALGLSAAWLAPGREGITLRQAFRLLPVLAYCMGRATVPPTDEYWQHLPRLVRYLSNIRQLSGVTQANREELASRCAEAIALAYDLGQSPAGDVAEWATWGPQRPISKVILPAEEAAKLRLYTRLSPPERAEAEALLWALEDEDYNKGEVSHLCADASLEEYDLVAVRRLSRRYHALSLGTRAGRAALQTLFLYRGDCATQDKESYLYQQYNYGNWPRILRNTGRVFDPFFKQFLTDESLTVSQCHSEARHRYFSAQTVAEHLADTSFDSQLRVLALVFEYFQRNPPPGGYTSDDIPSLWSKGSEIGHFYHEYATGRDTCVDSAQEELFGEDNTVRFWNASQRLSSALRTREALLPQAYRLFRSQQPEGTSYRVFVEECLLAAGARTGPPASILA